MAVHDEHPTNQSKKRGWATYIPRPGSSHGTGSRPGSSSSAKSTSSSASGPSTPPVTPRSNSFVGSFGKRPGSSGSSGGGGGSGYKFKEIITSSLATPQEGKELDISQLQSPTTPIYSLEPSQSLNQPQSPGVVGGMRLPHRASTADGVLSPPPSRPASRPSTPKRWSSSLLLTSSSFSPKPHLQELDNEADQLILNAIERTNSKQTPDNPLHQQTSRMSTSKSYLSSMIGGLSMSLSRTNTRDSVGGGALEEEEREREREKEHPKDKDKDRGRALFKPTKRTKSSSQAPPDTDTDTTTASRSRSRARSQSPFFFRRRRRDRDSSPTPQPLPLAHSETDLSDTSSNIHPRNAFITDDQDSGDETVGETDYSDEDDNDFDDFLDPVTEHNTEQNAIIIPVVHSDPVNGIDEAEPDPLGEGVNVVVPPEPYFPSSLNALGGSNTRNKRNPRRRKSVKHHDPLHFHTSRPNFQRDRCTITVTQGDPVAKLGDRKKRKYVIASDLSEESRYAVEWGIGTVLRDGDEMLVVTVVENENKVDPELPNSADRTVKLRSQQERQGLAYILVRQVTGLLQRTRLNITVACQAWHAKNARHMLLDIVDYMGPTMLIVGSRGLGQLNGILLGSTSHYLIQKCSVPVMVARRRLKRPPKKSAHLYTNRTHVKLSEAGIDRVAAKVDQDVKVMRDEIQKDDNRRDGGPGSRDDRRGLVVSPSNNSEELLEQDEDEGEEGDVEGEGDNEGEGEGTLVKETEELKATG